MRLAASWAGAFSGTPGIGRKGRFSGIVLGLALAACLPMPGEWRSLGPFGGPAAVVAADPHRPKLVLAGTRNALLFRSENAGASWTQVPFPPQMRATLHTLAIDPFLPRHYLAGVSSESGPYSGLFRSRDGGETWYPVPDLHGRQVRAIAFFRGNSQILVAGTDAGVFLSRNGGGNWSRASPADNRELQPVVSVAFDPKDPKSIYAGTPHLPWKTRDGGTTWESIHEGMADDSDIFSIQVDRNRPQRVFAAACSGIYRSLNGGATWTRLPGHRDASFRTYTVVQDPQWENVLFAGTAEGVIRSIDGGNTWTRLTSSDTRSIAFDFGRLGRIFLATDDSGLLRSEDDGKTWGQINQGFCNRRLTALITAPYYPGGTLPAGSNQPGRLIAASGSDLFVSEDSGQSWKTAGAAFRKSALSGAAVVEPAIVPLVHAAPPPSGANRVYGIVETTGPRLLAATDTGLMASDDGGVSWHAVPGKLSGSSVQAIYRHPDRPGTVFAASFGAI